MCGSVLQRLSIFVGRISICSLVLAATRCQFWSQRETMPKYAQIRINVNLVFQVGTFKTSWFTKKSWGVSLCFLEFLPGETGEVPPSEFQIRDTPAPCSRNAGGSAFCSHFCTQQWGGYQPVSLAKNWKSCQGIFRHWEGMSEFGLVVS